MVKNVLLVLLAVLGLTGLSAAAIWGYQEFGWSFRQGTVVEKWFEPYREWDTQRQVCGTYDKNNNCTWWYYVTDHHVDDEDYMVKVRGCRDGRPEQCKTEDWELTPQAWEPVQIGDVVAKP